MKELNPILIEGAMDVELSHLLSCLENKEEVTFGGFTYSKGTLNGVPVVLVASRIGIVNATIATLLGIYHFKPRCVISQGTSGAHNPDLRRGDIVLGENIVCFDAHLSLQRDEGNGMVFEDCLMFALESFNGDEWEKKISFNSDEKLLEIAKNTPYDYGKLFAGTVGTSMSWNREIDKIKTLRGMFNTDCEEMETWAIVQTCENFKVPFLSIRIISNSELTGEDYQRETAIYCQKYVLELIESLKKSDF